MQAITKPRSFPTKELIAHIVTQSAGKPDSIISYYDNPIVELKEVLFLNMIFKNNRPEAFEVLEGTVRDPALDFLSLKDFPLFYHGCSQTSLPRATLQSIYRGLEKLQSEKISDDIKGTILFLHKLCSLDRGERNITIDDLEAKILIAFGQAKNQEDFNRIIRPIIFIKGDEYSKGKYDAIACIANQLKNIRADASLRKMALRLLGISIQSKKTPPHLNKKRLILCLKQLEDMLIELRAKNMTLSEIRRDIAIRLPKIMFRKRSRT